MITYIPKFDDWKSLGLVNNNLTWLAIKPEAQVLLFRNHKHFETFYFEKFTRIFFNYVKNKEEINIIPTNALTKRVAVA